MNYFRRMEITSNISIDRSQIINKCHEKNCNEESEGIINSISPRCFKKVVTRYFVYNPIIKVSCPAFAKQHFLVNLNLIL